MLSSLTLSKKKMLSKGSEYLYKYVRNTSDKRNYLIEPMCCLIRLGILCYKSEGTKICIYDNSITYYEPTVMQGILRTWNGDNREDLHNLFNPIIVALKWFNPSQPFYKPFFERTCQGIKNLKKVYESNSIIHHTLNHFIRTIEDALSSVEINKTLSEISKGFNIEPEPEAINLKEEEENPMMQSTIKNDHINFIEVFKNLWSENELTIINSTFEQLSSIKENKNISDEYQRKEILDTYLKSIEIIVRQKEKQVQSIIMSTITTY